MIALFLGTGNMAFGQLDSARLQVFQNFGDSLKSLALSIGTDTVASSREAAVHKFIPYLVKALRTPTSFQYPFNEVLGVSFKYSPDMQFRTITFQFRKQDGSHRYYGALQMNESEKLNLIPLIDMSDTMEFQTQDMLSADNWFGSIYYNILVNKIGEKSYYTLLGFDANDLWSNKKIIELLHFEDGRPVFGAPLISITDTFGVTTIQNRFYLEFKHDTKVGLNFHDDKNMIVYDHLVPYDPEYEGLYFTYIPDGTYEGFVFENDKWTWVKKIFHFAINERDNPPVPKPVLNGNSRENKDRQN